MKPSRVLSELSKELKKKVSNQPAGSYNINITRGSDGVFRIETAFMLYRDSRLLILSLFKWLERNGSTEKNHNMYVDIKFLDAEEGPFKGTLFNRGTSIEKIDKLKMILDFDESKVYDAFPSRRYGFNSRSVSRFEPNQKFIPKEDSPVDPKFYSIPDTTNCGINFETLNQGFLRLQYIGGKDYIKRPQEVLEILSEFSVSAWNCTINPGYSKDNITSFEKIVFRHNKIRESYLDYAIFKKNFPSIKLTVDLIENPKTVYTFYQSIRDRIYELLTNIEFKEELEMNYDTTLGVLQLRGGKLRGNVLRGIDFVNCEIEFGTFESCDFYNCEIKDATIMRSNLFLDSIIHRSRLIDSVCNRTIELHGCEFDGANGVLNGKMEGGIFRGGGIGVHAEVSKDTIVIEYRKLKPGYMVAGDQVLIPLKKYDPIKDTK
jgi:uncharacterized protein YjbI with pentapeptide repeats